MRHKIEGSRFDMRGGSQRAKEKSWGKRKREREVRKKENSQQQERKKAQKERQLNLVLNLKMSLFFPMEPIVKFHQQFPF